MTGLPPSEERKPERCDDLERLLLRPISTADAACGSAELCAAGEGEGPDGGSVMSRLQFLPGGGALRAPR